MIKQTILLTILLGVTMSFMGPHLGKLKYEQPPTYRIDLNVPAEHRWDAIIPEYTPFLTKFLQLLDLFNVSDEVFIKVGEFGESNVMYEEFIQEIKGMVRVYKEITGSTDELLWQKQFLLNFFFELDVAGLLFSPQEYQKVSQMCSAILARQIDGTILHGRNFDLFPMWLFSRGSIDIRVYRGDKYVAQFNTVAGAVCVWSGMNANGFSLTLNARGHMDTDVIQNIVDRGYITPPYLLRNVIQDESLDYDSVLEILKETNITESMYYALAGIDRGTLIEKGVTDYNHILEIGPDTEEWFIVQTNYDLWEDPGIDDRKTPASKRLNEIGQENITIDNLFEDVMVQWPTLNTGTIQTSSFVPSYTYSNMTVWYGTVDKYWQEEELGIEQEKDLVQQDPYLMEELEKEFFHFSDEAIISIAKRLGYYLGIDEEDLFKE